MELNLNFDRVLAIIGIVAAIVLVVLDKAGKLKGPVLLALLGVAALMTLPLALGNSWVKDIPWGMLKFSRGMLMVSIVAICYSVLAVWISPTEVSKEAESEQSEQNKHGPPFSVAVEGGFFSPKSDVLTPLWVVSSAVWKAPLSALVKFRIVNLQNSAAVISQLTIEAHTSKGWTKLARLDSRTFRFFWVNDGTKFSEATEIRPVMIDVMMDDRAIGPRETVKGWIALCYPRLNPPEKIDAKYRVTIADTTGAQYVGETDKAPGEDFGGSSLPVVGGNVDISKYRSLLIQDFPNYWR